MSFLRRLLGGAKQLQKALLAMGGPEAALARTVARAFHACVRTLESKSARSSE